MTPASTYSAYGAADPVVLTSGSSHNHTIAENIITGAIAPMTINLADIANYPKSKLNRIALTIANLSNNNWTVNGKVNAGSNVTLSITGATTAAPTYALDATILPTVVNGTIASNLFTATANAASAQSFDYVAAGVVTAITPTMKFTPGTIFAVDPSSAISSLKLNSLTAGLLANGDKLLVDDGNSVMQTADITISSSSITSNPSINGHWRELYLCSFTINGSEYMLASGSDFDTYIMLYRWNGTAWVVVAEISIGGVPYAGAYGEIAGVPTIFIGNYSGYITPIQYNGTTWGKQSNIAIATRPRLLKYVYFNNTNFIHILEQTTGSIYTLYWDGSSWLNFNKTITRSSGQMFSIAVFNGSIYMGITGGAYGDYAVCTVFKWDNTNGWIQQQNISIGAWNEQSGGVDFFVFNSELYLSFNSRNNGNIYTYKLNSSNTWIAINTLSISGSSYKNIVFNFNNKLFLCRIDGSYDNYNLYYWDNVSNWTFIQAITLTNSNESDMVFKSINGNLLIMLIHDDAGVIKTYAYNGSSFVSYTMNQYTITSPSLSVAVPSFVAKGGQQLQYSVSATSTLSFSTATLSYTRSGNVITATGTVATVNGQHVQIKALSLNNGDILSQIGATLATGVAQTINGNNSLTIAAGKVTMLIPTTSGWLASN